MRSVFVAQTSSRYSSGARRADRAVCGLTSSNRNGGIPSLSTARVAVESLEVKRESYLCSS